MTTRNPTWVAEDYRFYADTGTAGSSALAAQNAPAIVQNGAKFRLRVAVGETNNANTANVGSWTLQFIRNGGTPTTVGAATTVKYVTSDAAAFVDGSTLTQALGGVTGAATYQSAWSEQVEDGAVASQTWTDDDTEYEYCLQLNGTSPGDTVTFRMLSPSSSTAVTFTNVPTLYVPVNQDSTFTSSPSFFAATVSHVIPQAARFDNASTFYGGDFSGDQTVTQGNSFTGAPSFYGGVVGLDQTVTQGSRLDGSPSFYAATVTLNPQGRYFGPTYFGSRHFGARYWGTIPPVPVDGAYFGQRFFGGRYWGARYWGSNARVEPFFLVVDETIQASATVQVTGNIFAAATHALSQVTPIALSATAATQGDLQYIDETWDFAPPLEVQELAGTFQVAGNIEYTISAGNGDYFGGRYFGGRYWGTRYWGTHNAQPVELVASAAISAVGTVTVAGGIQTALAPTFQTLALTGTTQVAGAIQTALNLTPGNTLSLSGTTGVTGGALQYELGPTFQPVGLSGTMQVAADVSYLLIVAGNLAATESAVSDTAAVAGQVRVAGSLAATETGADTVLIVAGLGGYLEATETGADIAAIFGDASDLVAGNLAATDSADTAAVSGVVLVQGSVSVAESGAPDVAAISGRAPAIGVLAAVETGADTAYIAGLDVFSKPSRRRIGPRVDRPGSHRITDGVKKRALVDAVHTSGIGDDTQ